MIDSYAVDPQPPTPPRRPHRTEIHGIVREDPYHWMRQRGDPEVVRHLRQENAYTEAILAPLEPLREKLYREFLGRIQETDSEAPYPYGGYFYYERTVKGLEYPLYCRRKGDIEAPEEVVLDVNILAQGHEYFDLGAVEVSPDHRLLAYLADTEGDEAYTLHILNLDTGVPVGDPVPNLSDSLAWADRSNLFFVELDPAKRPWRLYRRIVGGPARADGLLLEEPDGRFLLGVTRSQSGEYLFAELASESSGEVHFLSTAAPQEPFRLLLRREPEHEYSVEHWRDSFLIRTNREALDFRIVSVPIADPRREVGRELVPYRPGVRIEEVLPLKDFILVHETSEGQEQIRVIEPDLGAEHLIELPDAVHTICLGDNAEYETGVVRLEYSSPIRPRSVIDYNLRNRTRVLVKQQEVLGGFDPDSHTAYREEALAADGTAVPVTLFHRKGLPLDGSNPCLLYGYGAYGITVEPSFRSNWISLIDRGWVCAIAHPRGGGLLGEGWYKGGKGLKKKNTFTDFIAVAEHLVARGYTRPERLAIRGGSAGGLLMGAVMNLRPHLFRAVAASVPFVDVVNTMLDPALPLTVNEYEEWGNPDDRAFFEYMLSYSPYDQVHSAVYPDVLIQSGLNDSRVQYWEAAKWAARLRHEKRGESLVLLKMEMDSGHGGASGRYGQLRELAFEFAFLVGRVQPEAVQAE